MLVFVQEKVWFPLDDIEERQYSISLHRSVLSNTTDVLYAQLFSSQT